MKDKKQPHVGEQDDRAPLLGFVVANSHRSICRCPGK